MKNEEATGIGIIGCGTRVRDLIRDTISVEKRLKVVALCDPNDRAITRTMELCNCPDARRYDDFHALVADPGVQWIAIGSINAVHKDHVRAASFGGLNFFLPGNNRHIERIGADKNGKKAYMTWTDYSFYRDDHDPNPFASEKAHDAGTVCDLRPMWESVEIEPR